VLEYTKVVVFLFFKKRNAFFFSSYLKRIFELKFFIIFAQILVVYAWLCSFKTYLVPKPKKDFSTIWIVLGIFFLALFIYFSFEKSVKKDQNGKIIGISEAQQEKFRADSLKLSNCVQYVLRARNNGFYARCDGQGKVFLLAGEVYKYGVTCEPIPQRRYSNSFYETNNLRFVVQFFGHHLACEIEEKRKLYHYPALPENLKRPEKERLILPIGNCKTQ